VGDCTECIGEVNETLNACTLDSASCVSTLSDDEAHFAAPWAFDGERGAAIELLLAVAGGGQFDPGLIDTFGGVKQTDAAAFIAKGVLAVVAGGDMPERPQRQRKGAADFVPFDGQVVERRTTPGGAEYVRITLGTAGGSAGEVADPSTVIDAEFLFLPDDNIVDVRAASRVEPEGGLGSGGQLALSFTEGLVLDRNVARRQMERLRTALRWEPVPVIADFNPAFNSGEQGWMWGLAGLGQACPLGAATGWAAGRGSAGARCVTDARPVCLPTPCLVQRPRCGLSACSTPSTAATTSSPAGWHTPQRAGAER
jgi:hypothetical protein